MKHFPVLQQKTEQLANVGKEVETLNNNKKELEKKLRNRAETFYNAGDRTGILTIL
jgi:hypothetical protein